MQKTRLPLRSENPQKSVAAIPCKRVHRVTRLLHRWKAGGDLRRTSLRDRVIAGLNRVRQQGKRLGRPKGVAEGRGDHQDHLNAGNGILKVAKMVGCGSGTVQRVKREMAEELVEAV